MRKWIACIDDPRYDELVSARPGGSDEAAGLLRRAREASGLRQSELARLAKVPQSVISAYENGRRQPSLPTLRRLVEAAGQQLAVDIGVTMPLAPPRTPTGRLLRRRQAQLRSVAAGHGVTKLRLFGSVARGDDGPDSDIDLVADFPDTVSLLELLALRRDLTKALGAPVNVVPARSLRPEVAAEIEREGILL